MGGGHTSGQKPRRYANTPPPSGCFWHLPLTLKYVSQTTYPDQTKTVSHKMICIESPNHIISSGLTKAANMS